MERSTHESRFARASRGNVNLMDVCSPWRSLIRKFKPLRVIPDKSLRGPFSRHQFIDKLSLIHRRAMASSNVADKTMSLWRAERLGFTYCDHEQPEHTLNDPAISTELQPILHVGLGVAAVKYGGFAPGKIADFIQHLANPKYNLFTYEPLGFIWVLYEKPWLQMLFRSVARTDIPPHRLPRWSEFVGDLSPQVRQLISHGYGRGIYFQTSSVGRAIRKVTALNTLDTAAAVQGVAFAYAMVNHRDLDRILSVDGDWGDPEIVRAFDNGLIYALAFWEWAYPGFLESVPHRSDRQADLLARAEQLIVHSRRAGRLSAFGVGS